MAPLIDIVFLLLIFFMVTTVFPEQSGLQIEKPESEHSAQLTNNHFVVTVDQRGEVFFKEKRITMEDLKRLLKETLQFHPDNMVLIKADRRSTTEALIRVMDAGKSCGAKKIGIATDDKATER
ncbi:MAG: biopolymer transporter ExbD [Proteobacteria bacterium]|nr:biopolymer transporter ExbD [Pseudomonadota bacterium]MBU1709448.1 biopolymer transporter ExbD [Pseudomonadota bacterium]